MMNNMPTGMKKHRKSTKPESHQMAKIIIIFFFFFFRLDSSKLRDSFKIVFAQNSSILH